MFYYGKYQDRCFDSIPPLDPKIRYVFHLPPPTRVHNRKWVTDAVVDRPLLHESDEVREQVHLPDGSTPINYLVGYGRRCYCQHT
jgi:hypothetical protein